MIKYVTELLEGERFMPVDTRNRAWLGPVQFVESNPDVPGNVIVNYRFGAFECRSDQEVVVERVTPAVADAVRRREETPALELLGQGVAKRVLKAFYRDSRYDELTSSERKCVTEKEFHALQAWINKG